MSAQTWYMISLIGFIAAAILSVITVIIFLKMDIRSVYNDLSGKSAARGVREIREAENKVHNRSYQFSLDDKKESKQSRDMTDQHAESLDKQTMTMPNQKRTAPLTKTDKLKEEVTEQISKDIEEYKTTVLSDAADDQAGITTSKLSETTVLSDDENEQEATQFQLTSTMILTQSDEIIE